MLFQKIDFKVVSLLMKVSYFLIDDFIDSVIKDKYKYSILEKFIDREIPDNRISYLFICIEKGIDEKLINKIINPKTTDAEAEDYMDDIIE